MKSVRFIVEIWKSPDEPVMYTAIANALHFEGEGFGVAGTPGEASKIALDGLAEKLGKED